MLAILVRIEGCIGLIIFCLISPFQLFIPFIYFTLSIHISLYFISMIQCSNWELIFNFVNFHPWWTGKYVRDKWILIYLARRKFKSHSSCNIISLALCMLEYKTITLNHRSNFIILLNHRSNFIILE